MPSTRTLTDHIWNQSVDRIIDLQDELQKLYEQDGLSQLEAMANVDKILKRVRELIADKINYCKQKNIAPNFRFSDTSTNRLIGRVALEADPEVRAKFLHRHILLTHISTLSWKEFEQLCAISLELSGFTKVDVGKRTKDGGLDFFGVNPLRNKLEYTGCMTDEHYRVFGQAKHRKNAPVTGDEVRAFSTKFNDFVKKEGSAYNYVHLKYQWFIDTQGALIAMVITNTNFEEDAKWFAFKEAIRLREGIDIVEDIVLLANANDWLKIEDGVYVFAPDRFNQYLQNFVNKSSTT